MASFFRRVSKSKIGTAVMAVVLLAILASFAIADLSNVGTGSLGFGLSSSTLAEVGSEDITDRDISDAMQRQLQAAREQNPNADYASIAAMFDPLLEEMIDERAIIAFGDKYGFRPSKALIDAEIAGLPGVRGLNGQPSIQGYQAFLQRAQLTDRELRRALNAQIVARYLVLPASAEAYVPVGMARPYAAMMLEAREGQAAVVPYTAFTAALKPTDPILGRYYEANLARYTVPEQRVVRFARIGAEQVEGISATDEEIAAYYKANQATYAAKETRTITQAVLPNQQAAASLAAKVRGGSTVQAAARDLAVALTDQSRAQYASAAGDAAAAAVFAAKAGQVIGPVRSEFGWLVAKIESVKAIPGKSLDAARAEIATKLTAEKRKAAIEELIYKVQTAIDSGSNFREATAESKLPVVTTPPVMANGTARADPGYRLPPDLTAALKTGFDISPSEQPEIVELPDDSGYVIVSPAEVIPAAPAPFAEVRERVLADWTLAEGLVAARKAAAEIVAKVNRGVALTDAVRQSGAALPIQPMKARRLEITQANRDALPALRTLFSLPIGKSRLVPDSQGRGFFVVKVDKITPGNPLLAIGLINQMSADLKQAAGDDYARQFVAAMRKDLKVRRNDKAIEAAKQRITSSGG
ncbi:MAG TPA: peptidyl-prolyl cis-trans isomerase [Sphingomicrobium sp.]|nr:peptidyl-prolyl cis-trans isomerase [Sphingomicrobium sp.]